MSAALAILAGWLTVDAVGRIRLAYWRGRIRRGLARAVELDAELILVRHARRLVADEALTLAELQLVRELLGP